MFKQAQCNFAALPEVHDSCIHFRGCRQRTIFETYPRSNGFFFLHCRSATSLHEWRRDLHVQFSAALIMVKRSRLQSVFLAMPKFVQRGHDMNPVLTLRMQPKWRLLAFSLWRMELFPSLEKRVARRSAGAFLVFTVQKHLWADRLCICAHPETA